MIITRTPLRISLFGGGTDYPVWYKKMGGATLSTTIDKYVYITMKPLHGLSDKKYSVSYSELEKVNSLEDIQHPSVRESLRYLEIHQGMDIHYTADLPARAGLGSSSAFTVGLLMGLYAIKGKEIKRNEVLNSAIYVEQEMIKENVGSQDQVAAVYGGFNHIVFEKNSQIHVHPVSISDERECDLLNHMMLFFTGFTRNASDIAREQIRQTPGKYRELVEMKDLVTEALDILKSDRDILEIGNILDRGWQLKRSLTDLITNSEIDSAYDSAIRAGAKGGKLLGAGGGGFLLILVDPKRKNAVKTALKNLTEIPFTFENEGSEIVYASENVH